MPSVTSHVEIILTETIPHVLLVGWVVCVYSL